MPKKHRSDGEGSLHQMHVKDCPRPVNKAGNSTCKCKWRGAYIIGHKGKAPIRKTVTGPTRQATSLRLDELKAKYDANTLPTGKPPTLEQWLNHCHAVLLRRGKRPLRESSLVTQRGIMDNYLIPLLGHHRLDRLTADHIEDAYDHLAHVGNPKRGADARPLSPATVHQTHSVLHRCLRLAVQKKRIAINPASADSLDAPSEGKTEAEPLKTEHWQRVLDLCRDPASDITNPARYTVALALGLRQGEALGLRWQDVDLDAATLRVRQTLYRLPRKGLVFGEPKTDVSRRPVGLPDELVADLRRHRLEQNEKRLRAGSYWTDHDLVFCLDDGRPLDPSVDRRRWKRLLVKADVPIIKLHAARHTAATVLLLEGVPIKTVMEIMGWSQVKTATNYQHAIDEAHKGATSAIGRRMFGQSSG